MTTMRSVSGLSFAYTISSVPRMVRAGGATVIVIV